LREGKAQAPSQADRLGSASAIHDASGVPVGWLVPVLDGPHILGFVQLDSSSEFVRFSHFHTAGDYPEAALWLDPERVRLTAQQVAQAGDTLGEATLSFYKTPARPAWVVPLRRGSQQLTIYVTGTTVWTENDGRLSDTPNTT
jgi:hypothetical protein